MTHFYWDCDLNNTLPDQLLYACADQLILVEEILRKPDEGGNGEDFTLTAGAASGLATVVLSMEQTLRALGHRLGSAPVMQQKGSRTGNPSRPGSSETWKAVGEIIAVLSRMLEHDIAASAPEEHKK